MSSKTAKTEQRSSPVCQAEGKGRRKATSGAQGMKEVLLGGWGISQLQDLLQHISLLPGLPHRLHFRFPAPHVLWVCP